MTARKPHDSSEDLNRIVRDMVDRQTQPPLGTHDSAIEIARRESRLEMILGNRSFNLISPGGNRTCLLEPNACTPEQLPIVARQIMEEGLAEQVGILGTAAGGYMHVQMSNGDFCLNAIRTAAAIEHKRHPKTSNLHILCSGSDAPVECRCEDTDIIHGKVRIEAIMSDLRPNITKHGDRIALVHMSGISHFLVRLESEEEMRTRSARDLQELMKQHADAVHNVPAVGAIFYTYDDRGLHIKPIVHSLITMEETGCESGSAAIGMYLHCENEGYQNMQMLQPSGERYVVAASSTAAKARRGNSTTECFVDIHVASTVHIERDCTDLKS